MKNANLETLFHDGLRDILYAERKILKSLPRMMRAARSQELKSAFELHKTQTETQIERLQQVFEMLGKRAQGKTCPAIDGILEEGEEVMESFSNSPALDAGLVAAAQAVEHYEMARYGTLKSWAEVLGMTEAAALLEETLAEEKETDEIMTGLADGSVNEAALQDAA
jgi:ferritin-like metal-binding protein YciE